MKTRLFALGLVVWQLVTALIALSRGGKGDPERLLLAGDPSAATEQQDVCAAGR